MSIFKNSFESTAKNIHTRNNNEKQKQIMYEVNYINNICNLARFNVLKKNKKIFIYYVQSGSQHYEEKKKV